MTTITVTYTVQSVDGEYFVFRNGQTIGHRPKLSPAQRLAESSAGCALEWDRLKDGSYTAQR